MAGASIREYPFPVKSAGESYGSFQVRTWAFADPRFAECRDTRIVTAGATPQLAGR